MSFWMTPSVRWIFNFNGQNRFADTATTILSFWQHCRKENADKKAVIILHFYNSTHWARLEKGLWKTNQLES